MDTSYGSQYFWLPRFFNKYLEIIPTLKSRFGILNYLNFWFHLFILVDLLHQNLEHFSPLFILSHLNFFPFESFPECRIIQELPPEFPGRKIIYGWMRPAFIVVCECFPNGNGSIMDIHELIGLDVVCPDWVIEGFNVSIILRSVFLYIFKLDSQQFHGIPELMWYLLRAMSRYVTLHMQYWAILDKYWRIWIFPARMLSVSSEQEREYILRIRRAVSNGRKWLQKQPCAGK